MQLRFLPLYILLSLVSILPAQAHYTTLNATGSDLSSAFGSLMQSGVKMDAATLSRYHVLFVPGFNADRAAKYNGYFEQEKEMLRKMGLREGVDFRMLTHENGFSGERGVTNNGSAIRDYLSRSPKPVLLISHSKGSVDVLDALLSSQAARQKVAGWFSLQGAIGGSNLADVLSRGWRRPIVGEILKKWGGNLNAIDDLRTRMRQRYLEEHQIAIEELLREVPIISFASVKRFENLSPDLKSLVSLFDPEFRTREGDGMIDLRSALIPGSPFVVLEGVDHVETIYRGEQDLDRGAFFQATLVLLESRARSAGNR